MATVKRLRRSGPPRRRWIKVLAAVLAIVLGLFAWFHDEISGQASAAAAYGARVGCACHFIGGRPIDQCRADFMPGMGLVTLGVDEEEKSVSARYLLLARDTARLRPGAGCVLDSWND